MGNCCKSWCNLAFFPEDINLYGHRCGRRAVMALAHYNVVTNLEVRWYSAAARVPRRRERSCRYALLLPDLKGAAWQPGCFSTSLRSGNNKAHLHDLSLRLGTLAAALYHLYLMIHIHGVQALGARNSSVLELYSNVRLAPKQHALRARRTKLFRAFDRPRHLEVLRVLACWACAHQFFFVFCMSIQPATGCPHAAWVRASSACPCTVCRQSAAASSLF